MKFIPTAKKGFVKVSFIDGALSRFDGKTLSIGMGPFDSAQGKEKSLSRRQFVLLMRKVVSVAKQNKVAEISVHFKDIKSLAPKDFTDNEVGKVTATSFLMANYEHNTYKTKPKGGFASVTTAAITNTPEPAKKGGFWVGEQIGAAVNACRELSNTPGGDMTPTLLAEAAEKAAKGTSATVEILDKYDMEQLGMGGVLGVAKGSNEEPKFIIMEYWGDPESKKPIVLLGKGVTFDTGGLQVKPGDAMYEMHLDMSGGAAVIHTVALAAKMKLKANVIGLVPAVENSSSGTSMRPGDILKSLSGKTIEVLHTDAEGRIILADAITYAKRYNPRCVVDVATLTGAALVALGTQASGLMSNDQEFAEMLQDLGEESGDYVWPFPLWEEYDDMVKGNFGDVPNISTAGNSRYGGVIAGGKFLEVFAKELKCPWAHLDIAPRMVSAPNEFLAKGAAGAPVRLLLALVQRTQLR